MSPEEFNRRLKQNAATLQNYAQSILPAKMGNIALRFINGNFRAQGFQGTSFSKWKPNKRNGTILVKSGRLRAATTYTVQTGQVTIRNSVPYAKIHNEGFSGTVSVKAYTRNTYGKMKIETNQVTKTGKARKKTVTMKTGERQVKAHTRNVNLPKRQFIPTPTSRSPVLERSIEREIIKDVKNIIL